MQISVNYCKLIDGYTTLIPWSHRFHRADTARGSRIHTARSPHGGTGGMAHFQISRGTILFPRSHGKEQLQWVSLYHVQSISKNMAGHMYNLEKHMVSLYHVFVEITHVSLSCLMVLSTGVDAQWWLDDGKYGDDAWNCEPKSHVVSPNMRRLGSLGAQKKGHTWWSVSGTCIVIARSDAQTFPVFKVINTI